MRILHLHSGNIYGGIEAMLTTLAREGRRQGRAADFGLCFTGRLYAELEAAGVAPVLLGEVRLRNPLALRRVRRRARALLAERRPDVAIVHSPWSHAVFGPEIRAAGIPLVAWQHGPSEGALHRLAVRTVPDAVICNSTWTAASLPEPFRGVRHAVVHCPVPPPPPDASAAREPSRRALGVSSRDVVILQASRLEPWKGHEIHMRALATLTEAPWTFWIAGAGYGREGAAYERALRRLVDELRIRDRVRFLGERADIPALMAAADVYGQPTISPEPFGVVYVEALWAGLPVVASDGGGATDVVTRDCGFLVPPADAPALAHVLAALLADAGLRRRLGAAGPARAATLCDPARQVRRLEAFVDDVVRHRGAA